MTLKIIRSFLLCLMLLLSAGMNARSQDLESGPYIMNPALESSDRVLNGKEVFFGATQLIRLKPGFEVKSGGFFRAQIGDFTGLTLTTDSDTDGLADWRELLLYGDLVTKPDPCDNDIVPPVLTLVGAETLFHRQGTPFIDPGASASDNCDPDVNSNIAVNNPVDVNLLGSYTITYTVSDLSGNPAAPVYRTVIVKEYLSCDDVIQVDTTYTYDKGGRLKQIKKQVY